MRSVKQLGGCGVGQLMALVKGLGWVSLWKGPLNKRVGRLLFSVNESGA